MHDGFVHVLGEDIGRIGLSVDLVDLEITGLQTLLDPQVSDVEMTYLAEPTASADTYSRAGIREKVNAHDPQIGRKGLKSQRVRGTLHQPRQLCLTTR